MSTPRLSIIIPVYASGSEEAALLDAGLRSLRASDFQDFEVLVADDGSSAGDAVREVTSRADAGLVTLVSLDRCQGPAAARNAGAKRAKGGILVFLDADVIVHPDTLSRVARKFEERPELDAVMGSYDQRPAAPGRVSRFRNLLHSFVHHSSKRQASTFWAGCGAVRAERFRALGGFDESFVRPSIEDVEFGLRLHASGGQIELDPQIQVTHHKAWTFVSMVRTDLFARAIPWVGLMRRYPMPVDLNFKVRDRMSGGLVAVAPILMVIAVRHGGWWSLMPLVCLATIAALNWRFFQFMARTGSWVEALFAFPLVIAYFATCVAGLVAGTVLAEHRQDRLLWPVVIGIGVILLAVQIAGGAFTSEFMGYPDEASQFFSGLIIHDYLAALLRENAIAWAGQYYLHYPKVAIGHWPPLYHVMEAWWWLVLGPSRLTSMLLQWAIGLTALSMLYRLSRAFLSLPITLAILALTIAAPVFRESLEQTMADVCCLLWSVLFMHAAVRLVERQDRTALFHVMLWLVAAAMTKGTAVCLVPVPALALLANPQPIRIRVGWLAAAAGVILAAGGWYFAMGGIGAWGGMSASLPWPVGLIGHLAGWGFLAIALAGLSRNSLALVAGSVVTSTVGVSYVVRAMREDRHWIMVLPAILLLAGLGVARFRRPWIAPALLVVGLALFPYSWSPQPQSEFAKLAEKLNRPARMMVSSAGLGEGALIAAVGLTETRPSSFVARASKVLVKEGWNGEGYQLLAATPDAVLRRLDELALDNVIVHTPAVREPPRHHGLLRETLSRSSSWKLCASAQDLLAYCRVSPPRFPRQPLRLQVHGWDLVEKIP